MKLFKALLALTLTLGAAAAGEENPAPPTLPSPTPETGAAAAKPAAGLPARLVKLPRGEVTAEEFLQALGDSAAAAPSHFGLGDNFLRHQAIVMEALRLRLNPPAADELDRRIAVEARKAQAAGEPMDKQLADANISTGDFRRMMREGMLFEAIARKRSLLAFDAAVDAELVDKTYTDLMKEYKPEFFGFAAPGRVATVGGVNFGRTEVVEYLCKWGDDSRLRGVLEGLVQDKLVLGEAERLGVDIRGITAATALDRLTAPHLTDDRLRQYYEKEKAAFALIRVSHIFLAFDSRPGQAYAKGGEANEKDRTRARLLAETILNQLRAKEITFEQAATKYSECPSASAGGDLGYLLDVLDVQLGPSPKAYALDYVRTPRGIASPIVSAPAREIYAAAKTLADGEIGGPVETPTGYSIVRRAGAREPSSFSELLPFLRKRRLIELRTKMLEALRAAGVEYLWEPEKRGAK